VMRLSPIRQPLTDILTEPPHGVVCIPLLKNRQFVGRCAELDTLKRRVITVPDCQRLAVFGSNGMGKTQLVLSFAYWVAEQHPEISVFWIPALSVEAFERSIGNIAQKAGLRTPANQSEDPKELVKRHFSGPSAGKWLLIVDSADDIEMLEPSVHSDGLLRYLPESPSGVTVFTSRSSSTAQRLAGGNLLRLKKPTETDAVELLKMAILDADLLKDSTVVTDFLTKLDYEPLAISKAAAYINDNEFSITEYSRRFLTTRPASASALDGREMNLRRRQRRFLDPYAPTAASILAANYTPPDNSSIQIASAPGDRPPNSQSAIDLTGWQRVKPCYVMVVLGSLAISGSLVVGIFYSITQDRMGDGFTTAGWMVAVSTLVLAAPMMKHYPNCRCWGSHRTAVT